MNHTHKSDIAVAFEFGARLGAKYHAFEDIPKDEFQLHATALADHLAGVPWSTLDWLNARKAMEQRRALNKAEVENGLW